MYNIVLSIILNPFYEAIQAVESAKGALTLYWKVPNPVKRPKNLHINVYAYNKQPLTL